MKTLHAYLARSDSPSLTALAAQVGVTKGRLSQLRHAKDWPADLAIRVESATNGAVDAADISPVVKLARETGKAA